MSFLETRSAEENSRPVGPKIAEPNVDKQNMPNVLKALGHEEVETEQANQDSEGEEKTPLKVVGSGGENRRRH